jgi:hypothetical protein
MGRWRALESEDLEFLSLDPAPTRKGK